MTDQDCSCLMETAPWRVSRRWAATGSAERPSVVTHSTRTFPTTSRRTTDADDDESRRDPGPDRSEAEGGEGEGGGQQSEAETNFLTEEDMRNFDQLPATPTQQECRLLWAGLLEIQDEEAMRADTEEALASNASAMPTRLRLASRHLCRVRRLLQGRSTDGLLRLAMALPNLLHGIQETVAEEIEQELHTRRASRGSKRNREDGERSALRKGEDGEEEVEVEDEECELQHDEASMMQSRGKPTPKEEAWRPLTPQEKARLAKVIMTLLEVQKNAEPSLSIMAYIQEPPGPCDCEAGRDIEVSIGELRPAIIRWLRATPMEHVVEAVEVVLGIPGRTHPDPVLMQAAARQLQAETTAGNHPLLDQLLRNWSDSADIGLVEELLRMAMTSTNQAAVQKALSQLRGTRRARYPVEESDHGHQRTLHSVWQGMPAVVGNGTDWLQQSEDPGTLGVRTQLLGLQQAWPDLSREYWRGLKIETAQESGSSTGETEKEIRRTAQPADKESQDEPWQSCP